MTFYTIVFVLALIAIVCNGLKELNQPFVYLPWYNVSMPVITLGTGGYNVTEAEDAVLAALEVGFVSVHAAFDYYNLEGVGRGLSTVKDRSKVFVIAMTSPCFHNSSNPIRNVTNVTACQKLTETEVDETLKMLGIDYADLLLLHGPNEPFGFMGGCDKHANALNQAQWRGYTEMLKQGRARAIGVSNYCQSCLNALSDPVPAVNQVQWHVGMGKDPEQLMSFCKEQGIVVQAYSPLAAGGVVTDPLCTSIAKKYNKTSAEVGLQWVVRRQGVAVVVKASNPMYLKQDLDVFNWSLDEDDVEKLNQATEPKGQQDGRPSWGCAK